MEPLLQINDLHVQVAGKPILNGVSLTVQQGEVHAIMGPNGSGKSTLVNTLMGHPSYEITKGTVRFKDTDLLALLPEERARNGLFLAFQYPKEISGVTLRSFLFAAYNACAPKRISPIKFKTLLEQHMQELKINPEFAERSLNKGFSGGEKKKAEILQLKILHPALSLLDETDSGLDIDALKIVAQGVHSSHAEDRSVLLVTHYARILRYLKPNHVHVMAQGLICKSGGDELAQTLEEQGYIEYNAPVPSP